MSIDRITAPDRESLTAIDEALDGMMARLQTILSEPPLTQETLVEITSIYNNVAYIFLYLAANEEHVNYEWLLPWRDAFHKNPELDQRILELLVELQCSDPEAEESRLAYVEQLREKLQASDLVRADHMKDLLSEAKTLLGEIQQDQAKLLKRIGVVGAGDVNPSAAFYTLISRTCSAVTRKKLAQAWVAQRDRRRDILVNIVDQMIETHRRRSAVEGYETVMERTLNKCRVYEADVETFLERYLIQALASYASLESEVRLVIGVTDDPMDHFGFYIRTVFGGANTPLFVLDECLDYIFDVAQSAFGLTLKRVHTSNAHIIAVGVWAGSEEVGRINFDLWDTGSKAISPNHTRGLRNRTDWNGLVQRPVAHVSCRFQRGRDGDNQITFQNVHSLFHEFGHALNHLLIRKRISNQSGLEYLPLERLEYLSMWFEKWAYHPAFALHLSISSEDCEGVSLCQRIKMLEYRRTYVERAVTAALDFDVHRRSHGGLEASFQRLDEQFSISRYCTLGDFPAYFTWPMFLANPGANFTYLWGAADSCQKFASFQHLNLDEIASRPELRDLFAPCFDFDKPTDIPDSGAVFAFYDPVALQAPTTAFTSSTSSERG